MTVIGFHASLEQIHPTELLDAVQRAEQAGFTAAMCSDHFAPWSERPGHSAFAWAWLGAALQATSFPIGVVNAPGQRYHPAVIAQAIATLESMYPDRFWVALGGGEAVNEHVTGDAWPSKDHRNTRLEDSTTIIRSLLAAAVSAETAGWAARWADGLATVLQAPDALRGIVDAYRSNGGVAPLVLQVHLSTCHPTPRCMLPGCRKRSTSASTKSTCTTWGRNRARSSTRSANAYCQNSKSPGRDQHEDHRHQRPVVEERRRLLPRC